MKQNTFPGLCIRIMLFFLCINFQTVFAGLPSYKTGRPHFKSPVAEARGTIRDEDGQPLAGATITEKGTNNTTVAGSNGEF